MIANVSWPEPKQHGGFFNMSHGSIKTHWWLVFTLVLLVGTVRQDAWAQDELSEALPAGAGQFTFVDQGGDPNKSIRVYYIKPKRITRNTPVWFVMHGVNRNAEDYRDNWIELNQKFRAIILVPEFNVRDYPGSRAYNLGNMFDEQGEPVDRSLWSYSVIDRLFDHVAQREKIHRQGYSIFGHSAGAQFVHRLVLFVPDAKVQLAVAANAGWYTMPDTQVSYPYGLAGTSVADDGLQTAFNSPMVVLLGKEDNDPNHKHLRKTPEAEAQGPHRLARGRSFFNRASVVAELLDTPLAWRRIEVPRVGHSNTRMAPVAAKLMARAREARNRDR
jgi:poly(3-hydroxybutyrate) depolymerase